MYNTGAHASTSQNHSLLQSSAKFIEKYIPNESAFVLVWPTFVPCTTRTQSIYTRRQTNMKKELIHLVVQYKYHVYWRYMWQTRKNWVIALCFHDWKLRQPNSTQFYWMKMLFSLLKKCTCVLDVISAELAKILLDTFLWIKMENFLSMFIYQCYHFISGFDNKMRFN